VREGYVTRVYDGDTVTVVATLFRATYEFSVRVRGVDCPEMRTRDPDEKHVALLARDAVRALVLGRWVVLGDVAADKYGRLLATVATPEGADVAEDLLARRLAVPYGGRTKNAPANWRAFHEEGGAPLPPS
jgi:endonuclease YncB( thermonuclease family)